jgi:hypothetical protein
MGVPLSDAEALAVANTQRQLTHREEVGHLRRHALSELLGVKNIDVVTDEAGKETRIRNGQAETVVPTILRAATENRLSLDAFTADDLSNLYMEELGPSAEPPTAAEIKTIRTELNALLRDAQDEAASVRAQADRCGMPHVSHRWLGGTLTNFKTVKQSIKRLEDLDAMEEDGRFARLTKKEVLKMTRERDKFEASLGGIRDTGSWLSHTLSSNSGAVP